MDEKQGKEKQGKDVFHGQRLYRPPARLPLLAHLWAMGAVCAMLLSCASGSGPGAVDRLAENTAEAPAADAVDEPQAHSNTLRWSTASEVDNFGFDIYRAEAEEGPFERINNEPVPGAGTSDEPQSYEYVDLTIDPRKTYYYYIESISLSNERERFTPIYTAKPKL